MRLDSVLSVQAGFATVQGRRPDNQDYVGLVCPEGGQGRSAGIVAAVADGCGGFAGGRTAAELCVRTFLDGFLGLSETLGVQQRAARSLACINSWLHAVGQRDMARRNMATTFSALIMEGRGAHVVHVGDSRIYRLRGDRLERLTQDHTLKNPGLEHVLFRAIGMEHAVSADCEVHPVETHDRYLLCTDGVHNALKTEAIREVLRQRETPQACAEALVAAAVARDDSDNMTAAVLDVIGLPPPGADALHRALGKLPLLELPKVGDEVDGFLLEELLSRGRYSSLFVATGTWNQRRVVLKFPHPRVVSEREYLEAFVREAWIGLRIKTPWVAEIIELAPGRQTRLYSVMPHYSGRTLETLIGSAGPISSAQGVDIALKLCRAVHALHRQGVIHRDIKPENILLLDDGGLKLLDLGVARLPQRDEDAEGPIPGTPSYLAPEQFRGDRGSVASDVFAVGVTLYRLFAQGQYPYGEIEPFMTPRFGLPQPLAKFRPDLPAWLDEVLQRAIASDAKARYVDTLELAFDLENGLEKGAQHAAPPRLSWYQRHPKRFWQIAAIAQFLIFLFWLGFSRIPH